MSLRNTAVSGVIWTFSQQFGVQVIGFLVSIVMARLLLPEEFGLIGMITVFMALGQSLMDSGLTQSLIRTEYPDQKDYSTVFFFNLGGSILIYVLLFFIAPFIAAFYQQEILTNIIRVYCLSFIITAFSAVQLTRLTKEMNFKLQMIIAIPSLIISGMIGIALAHKGFGVWSLVWMQLLQNLLNTLQLWWRTRWVPSFVFSKEKFRHHLSFGYKLTISGIIDTIFQNVYQIIIGKFFIASQVGFYTRANSLRQLPVMNLSTALNKVTYPLFASIQHEDARLKSAYKEIMQMAIFLIAPLLIILAVLAEPVFRFLFTEKWLPAVPYFQVLCLAGILYPVHSYNLNVLKVKGRSDLFLRLEIIKKIVIILTITVTIQFGIIGLIWGQLATSILAFFINTFYTGKFLKYSSWEQTKDIFPIILLAFVVGAVVMLMDDWLKSKLVMDLLRVFAGGVVGGLMYTGIAFILKMDSFKSLKRIILKR